MTTINATAAEQFARREIDSTDTFTFVTDQLQIDMNGYDVRLLVLKDADDVLWGLTYNVGRNYDQGFDDGWKPWDDVPEGGDLQLERVAAENVVQYAVQYQTG